MWLNCCSLVVTLEQMRSCFLWKSKDSSFSRWNLLLVRILWRLLKWQKKGLEYYINLIDKTAAGFVRVESNSERTSTVCKILSNSVGCYREIIPEPKSYWCKLHCLIWRNSHSHPNLQQLSRWSESRHQCWGNTLHQQRFWLVKIQVIAYYSNRVFFYIIKACLWFFRHNATAHFIVC